MTHVGDEGESERSYKEWLDEALAQDARRWAEVERQLGRLREAAPSTRERAARPSTERGDA